MSVSKKWFTEEDTSYSKLKKIRIKMIRRGYACIPIIGEKRVNDTENSEIYIMYYFKYQREQEENAFKALPGIPEEYK